jgi:hypothetical protein
MERTTLAGYEGLRKADSPADVVRLTGIDGWLLWRIITLWIWVVCFALVAYRVRAQTPAKEMIVCLFYAIFAGITAYMLQTKKPHAVIVAAIFSLLSGSILWLIYFVVSRRVKYTYAVETAARHAQAGAASMRQERQNNGVVEAPAFMPGKEGFGAVNAKA